MQLFCEITRRFSDMAMILFVGNSRIVRWLLWHFHVDVYGNTFVVLRFDNKDLDDLDNSTYIAYFIWCSKSIENN